MFSRAPGFGRVACFVLVLALTAALAWADDETPDDDWLPEKRDQQMQDLAREVADLEKLSGVLKKVVRLVRPTVVHIEADKPDTERQKRGGTSRVEEAGSGFIIQEGSSYFVLTNYHVVRLAKPHDIRIRLSDGRQIHPLHMWQDPETDVAVLSISTPNLVASKLGNSDDVEIGDFVLALGSPFGLSHSTTFGIISAESRRDLELGTEVKYQDFLQTDAAINPGNSGGPLINLRGEVIGMNTAIASSSGGNEGIGFTIPINMVKVISRQLVDQGRVVRGRIGIHLDEKYGAGSATNVGLKLPRGARVTDVEPGTPAEAAHLLAGDVIVKFDNVRVENRQHLKSLVSLTEIGRDVPVQISRGGKALQLTIHVAPEASSRAATTTRQGK